MSDTWDEMKRAKEEQFFERQNQEALLRIKKQRGDKPRPSPITGEPMEQITLHGIVLDRCKTSGGIWFDAGELEELIKHEREAASSSGSWFSDFFGNIIKK